MVGGQSDVQTQRGAEQERLYRSCKLEKICPYHLFRSSWEVIRLESKAGVVFLVLNRIALGKIPWVYFLKF